MPLKLVLGPANSAKAGEVLGGFVAATRRPGPGGALLVVPTVGDALHYTRELAADGSVLGSIVTFAGLAAEIARRTDLPDRPVTALQRERLLERALAPAGLGALGDVAETPGFPAAADRLIAELERALVTSQRFEFALRRWAQGDPGRRGYAQALGGLYAAYARELERVGRVDAELYAWRALDALRLAPGRWGADQVFFYGFDELTGLERDAVETLSRVAGAQVCVSLNWEAGRVALAARAQAVQQLAPLASEVVELPPRDDHYAPGSRAALHHLERGLFEPGAARAAAGEAVVLLEAGGELAEAELVAAEVLALLREGVPGEQIAIVNRSMATAGPLLERVLSQYGVPVAADWQVPFAHAPLGRALLGAARCAFGGRGSASDLLAYLRAPGVLERPELVDRIEATLRIRGIGDAEEARARVVLPLPGLDALACAPRPLQAVCDLGRSLLGGLSRGSAPALADAERLDARALARLCDAAEELAELGLEPVGDEVAALLERLQVADGSPAAAGEVLLAEPLAIRARRFRAVVVCGLQEGAFPVAGRPEPFLSDDLRRELAQLAGLRLRPHEDALARERHLFYMAVSRATERVLLSYRSSDEEGNLALPSPFVADVAELWEPGWSEHRRRRLLSDVTWPPELAPTGAELARARAAAQAPPAGEPPVGARRLGAAALMHVRHGRILSAGALEAYADCPMRWLVERELRPRPLAPEPEAQVRGSVVHDLLERLLRRLGGPVTPQSLPRAGALLDELIAELGPRVVRELAPAGSQVVRSAAVRSIQADLRRYLEHEAVCGGDWRPLGLELRFGFEGEEGDGERERSVPALVLGEAEGTPVLLRGLIDRVDVDIGQGRRALVRDYKSGGARTEYQSARWGIDRRLQVALYMLVARELLGLEPVGGVYQPLRGEDLRARGVFLADVGSDGGLVANDGRPAEELDALLADAEARAVALAAALRAGTVTPCPQTCSRDGCAHPGICRSR